MEYINLYNNKREILNKTISRYEEPADGEYKLSVHVYFLNEKGELLIQKRNKNLKRNPSKWAFTGGAVDLNETSIEGAIREVREELGIIIDRNNMELVLSFKREHGFVDVWLVRENIDINNVKLNYDEVTEVKWATFDEVQHLIESNEFVKSTELYFDLFKKLLIRCYGMKL